MMVFYEIMMSNISFDITYPYIKHSKYIFSKYTQIKIFLGNREQINNNRSSREQIYQYQYMKTHDICYKGESVKTFNFPSNFDHTQSAVPDNPCYNFYFRIFVVVTYIVITQVSQIFGTPQETNIQCTIDIGHDITNPINSLINDSSIFASLLQISSGLILDFTAISVPVYWILHSRNFRLFAALLLFYAMRAIHLQLLKLHMPHNYMWKDPGVPSLVVKYGDFSDFFYSGHVGFLVICSLEMRKIKKKWQSRALFAASLYQAFIVIVFRIHYTIDVSAGFIYAHYFYNMICYWEAKIDYYLKRIADLCNRNKKPIRIENENEQEKQQV
ncbi:hypothetical protein pb186bvf_001207 [Paramecium bursaria]